MLFAKTFLTLEEVIICVLMSHMKMTEDRVVGCKLLTRFFVPRKLFIKSPSMLPRSSLSQQSFLRVLLDYSANSK